MNFHYYYFDRDSWGNIIGKADHLKALLAGYGVIKPTICTEVGIWGYEDPYYLSLQARYLPMAYTRGFFADLGAILWYPLASSVGWAFEGGLLREEDLSAKPAYLSYQTMAAELNEYEYSAIIETGDTNLEGYEFICSSSGKRKQVIWAQEDTSGYMAYLYESIRVSGIDGTEQVITDGGAGDLDEKDNGQIRIAITPSPIYVESYFSGKK